MSMGIPRLKDVAVGPSLVVSIGLLRGFLRLPVSTSRQIKLLRSLLDRSLVIGGFTAFRFRNSGISPLLGLRES